MCRELGVLLEARTELPSLYLVKCYSGGGVAYCAVLWWSRAEYIRSDCSGSSVPVCMWMQA